MKLIVFFKFIWHWTRHLIREKKRIAVLESTIKSVRVSYDKAKKNEMHHFERIYNASLYVLVFEYDMAILKNDALFATSKWKKNFVARQFAVILYEAAHDLPEILGKEYRETLKTLSLSDAELECLNRVTKNINRFKKEHHEVLSKLRNFVSAHRDKDAGKQLEIIENVNLLNMLELSGQFYEALRELVPFLVRITLTLGDWRVVLEHMPSKTFET